MFEVTAEMIERGRGGDPRITAERRRMSQKVREARDKLTSCYTGHRAFDMELLRLYAERRKAAAPAVGIVAITLAVVAMRWTSQPTIACWLGVSTVTIVMAYILASRFLTKPTAQISTLNWTHAFIAVETLQGMVWASTVLVDSSLKDPQVATFVLIAMLLVAAMNATVTASIPGAVYGALTPMTIAIAVAFRPSGVTDSNLLFVMLALGTLLYFLDLARRLHESSLQAFSFQAEKDELIAELEQSKANSDLARSRAEESNLAKSRFLATMSHELRTPLNAILGFSEIMKAELFGQHAVAAYKEYSEDIHSSGEHLLMLINEILDLSRVEAGHYELHETSVDLLAVVEECRHLVALRAKKKDISLLQEKGEVLPRLWADARAVRQVALNLLSNAVKFTPQGGHVIIRLGTTAEGGQFFSISDDGAGIPENEIPVVMSSFGRGALAQKNAEEGTGLGLPIVKGLVDLHGGTFELTSKVREGTRVTVRFPPERVMSVLARIEVDEKAVGRQPSKTPMRSAA
jgi:two-component system cell cycle sensor histidine kinase PleC